MFRRVFAIFMETMTQRSYVYSWLKRRKLRIAHKKETLVAVFVTM
jgi:hypothetical protein